METADHEVLRTAIDWLTAGETVYLATVAKTFGSSPRPPGSLAALVASGRFVGSVSGGCMEADLVARLRDDRLPQKFPALITYGVTQEEAHRFGLPCGGKLELVLERLVSTAPLKNILEKIDARQLAIRQLCLDTGEANLHPASAHEEFSCDGKFMRKLFGPGWRLLLIGAGQLSRFVAQMGMALDYEVIVCEPREELASLWHVDGAIINKSMPDDAVRLLADMCSAVLALTHDPKLDDMALLEALESPAFYVGALGSHANNDKRRTRLATLGVTPENLARLHGPVGLAIGSKTPAEIAVAVLAGVTAARHGIALEAKPEQEPAQLQVSG
ncbi:MAG: XdhC family protein [Gammaproteobacteria bacterium]|nr:XdhC family protein [Gammaproteobacteria bacterium]MDH3406943.1 XdhC family protein [Gammaproteobacteria bacterium]MDH3562672.1 XdhC family protein [Gammaproteobacteria bacterium]MDH5487564.1 XdhC family protein [Gammaproteobacteria bacterium]